MVNGRNESSPLTTGRNYRRTYRQMERVSVVNEEVIYEEYGAESTATVL